MDIKLLDLFSGTGGFALGLQNAGFNIVKHQFSENDQNAIANYKYNFKNAEYVGSVTDVSGQRNQADIITFGSPCQDFSLAGKRKGMAGQRSSLILEAIRLISEIQPSVFIWENVKGTFSSNNGADFWAILNAFANIGNYRLEWQLLNTSWFLPQSRPRIYLVGHLAGRSQPGIFPFTENDSIFSQTPTATKRQPQTKPSTTVSPKMGTRADGTFVLPKTANCFTAGGNSGGLHSDMTVVPVVNLKNLKSKTRRGTFKNGETQTLDSDCNLAISEKQLIRRLTEIECERLQGFPDNWTEYGDFSLNPNLATNTPIRKISKTQRYKMIGNAVTVNVVEAVASRLKLKSWT